MTSVGDDEELGETASSRITHPDIWTRIITFCDQPTLATLLRLSRQIHTSTLPHLYRTVTTSPHNIDALFLLPTRAQPISIPTKEQNLALIHSLTLSHHHCLCHAPPARLPSLHTLKLIIDPESPLGWRFCLPDKAAFPYYPINHSCRLIQRLRPKRLVISGIATLYSVPPLNAYHGLVLAETEVVVLEVEAEKWRRGSHKRDCFIEALPRLVVSLVIRLVGKGGFEREECWPIGLECESAGRTLWVMVRDGQREMVFERNRVNGPGQRQATCVDAPGGSLIDLEE